MTALDIGLVIFMLLGSAAGFRHGIVGMAAYLVCAVAGYLFFPDALQLVHETLPGTNMLQGYIGMITLVLLMLLLAIIAGLISKISRKFFKITMMNWLNQMLGGLAGLLMAVLLLMSFCVIAAHTPVEKPWVSAELHAESPVFSFLYTVGDFLLHDIVMQLSSFLPS